MEFKPAFGVSCKPISTGTVGEPDDIGRRSVEGIEIVLRFEPEVVNSEEPVEACFVNLSGKLLPGSNGHKFILGPTSERIVMSRARELGFPFPRTVASTTEFAVRTAHKPR